MLIYRGTDHGFTAKSFHTKCDAYSGTLVIIKTLINEIIGGYTTLKWDGDDISKPDSKAFIFVLDPYGKIIATKSKSGDMAIYCAPNYGPCFGSGDLELIDNFNNDNSCYIRYESDNEPN